MGWLFRFRVVMIISLNGTGVRPMEEPQWKTAAFVWCLCVASCSGKSSVLGKMYDYVISLTLKCYRWNSCGQMSFLHSMRRWSLKSFTRPAVVVVQSVLGMLWTILAAHPWTFSKSFFHVSTRKSQGPEAYYSTGRTRCLSGSSSVWTGQVYSSR